MKRRSGAVALRACGLAVGLTWLTMACGDPGRPEPTLTLGTGEARFLPLESGDSLQLIAGSQGGYHFWLSVRATGFPEDRLQMDLEVLPEGPARPSRSTVRIGFDIVEGAQHQVEHVGWPARVLEPWCAVDRPVLVHVTVTDGEGRSAEAMTEITPTAPRGGFSQDCEEAS